jgi:hypothetical protein
MTACRVTNLLLAEGTNVYDVQSWPSIYRFHCERTGAFMTYSKEVKDVYKFRRRPTLR